MNIEDWINEKRKLVGGDAHQLSRGSRIIMAWWNLAAKDEALRNCMKLEAERILNEREDSHA